MSKYQSHYPSIYCNYLQTLTVDVFIRRIGLAAIQDLVTSQFFGDAVTGVATLEPVAPPVS